LILQFAIMPITPRFQISQTLTHVSIEIRVPHVRVSVNSVEVVVDGPSLHFSSPPYLLILNFPAPFTDTDASDSAKYDPSREGGMVTLELRKEEPDLWQDLDLLGQLMRTKPNTGMLRAEIVSEERMEGGEHDDEPTNDDDTLLASDMLNIDRPRYGFMNQFEGVFTDLVREGLATEMLQLPQPDATEVNDRRKLRLAAEEETFDPDRYLGDLDIEEDYIYQCAMGMEPHWAASVDSLTEQMASLKTTDATKGYFTDDENSKLAAISYPILPSVIDRQHQRSLLLGLLDILFAYVYDHLITDSDPTIESSWTVCNLSCTLSWLEHFHSTDKLEDVIRFSVRRSLMYPYLRNTDFAMHCWNQVASIVKSGRRCIIRCLLQVRAILDKSEAHYLGNRLYIDPYLGWIQSRLKDDIMSEFSKDLAVIRKKQGCWIEKKALGLELIELEQFEDESGSEEESDDDSDSDAEDCNAEDAEGVAKESSGNGNDTMTTEDIAPASVSSALLDSEIGNLGMLRISDDEAKESVKAILESPKQPGKSLIQEL
jgi:protein SHQ1